VSLRYDITNINRYFYYTRGKWKKYNVFFVLIRFLIWLARTNMIVMGRSLSDRISGEKFFKNH